MTPNVDIRPFLRRGLARSSQSSPLTLVDLIETVDAFNKILATRDELNSGISSLAETGEVSEDGSGRYFAGHGQPSIAREIDEATYRSAVTEYQPQMAERLKPS